MTTPSAGSIAIARRIAEVLGRRPEVHRYSSDRFAELTPVDILTGRDWPIAGLHTSFTLNLSDEPLLIEEPEYELVISGRDNWPIEQLLGDIAVMVRRHTYIPAPGEAVYHGMAPSLSGLEAKHLLAVDPVMSELRFDLPPLAPRVALLQLVPIGDSELAMAERDGSPALLEALTRAGLDLNDFGRSVLSESA